MTAPKPGQNPDTATARPQKTRPERKQNAHAQHKPKVSRETKAKTKPKGASRAKAEEITRPDELDPTETHTESDKVFHFENLKRVSRMGRPPKLCPATHQLFITAMRMLGMSDAEGARLIGVEPPSIVHWKNQGEADEARGLRTAYTEFLNDYRASAPFFEAVHRGNIVAASRGYPGPDGKPTERRDWRASERALEFHDKKKYGRSIRVGLEPIFDLEGASREDLEAIASGHTPPSLLNR